MGEFFIKFDAFKFRVSLFASCAFFSLAFLFISSFFCASRFVVRSVLVLRSALSAMCLFSLLRPYGRQCLFTVVMYQSVFLPSIPPFFHFLFSAPFSGFSYQILISFSSFTHSVILPTTTTTIHIL